MPNSILDLRYLDGTNWLLLKEFTEHAIGYDPVTVPILQYNNVQYGFVTNLASIPRPLWSIIGHPAMFGPEAVIHDWLYIENVGLEKSATTSLEFCSGNEACPLQKPGQCIGE